MTQDTLLFLGTIRLYADPQDAGILRFKDAVLAPEGLNRNLDFASAEELRRVADTIAGRAIDLEHDTRLNFGFFTAGRLGPNNELRVDGVLWPDRLAAIGISINEIGNGKFPMSIEANADSAECSVCGATVRMDDIRDGKSDYCQHIKDKASRVLHGAKRIWHGLRSAGGALTENPAGAGTGFRTAQMMLLASDIAAGSPIPTVGVLVQRIEALEAKISERKDVSPAEKKRAVEEYGDVTYADEKNKKYPIDTKEHIQAAWNYINKAGNAAKYSSEEVSAIKSKIVSAWKKKIDPEGPPSAGKMKGASMDDKPKDESEVEACEDDMSMEDKKKMDDMKAAVAEVEAKLDSAVQASQAKDAEIEKLRADLESANTQLAALTASVEQSKRASLKEKLVGSGILPEADFEAKYETDLKNLTETAIALLMRAVQPQAGPGRLLARDERPATSDVQLRMS